MFCNIKVLMYAFYYTCAKTNLLDTSKEKTFL